MNILYCSIQIESYSGDTVRYFTSDHVNRRSIWSWRSIGIYTTAPVHWSSLRSLLTKGSNRIFWKLFGKFEWSDVLFGADHPCEIISQVQMEAKNSFLVSIFMLQSCCFFHSQMRKIGLFVSTTIFLSFKRTWKDWTDHTTVAFVLKNHDNSVQK